MSETFEPSEENQTPEPIPTTPEESATPVPPIFSSNEETHPTEEPTQESQEMKNKSEYQQALWISLFLNGLVILIFLCPLAIASFEGAGAQIPWGWGAIWLLVNILIMIFLYWQNQKAFQGMVAGFALGFLVTLLTGVFLGAICFSM